MAGYGRKAAIASLVLCGLWLVFLLPGMPHAQEGNAPETAQSPPSETPPPSEEEQRAARALDARLSARREQQETLRSLRQSIALSQERQAELENEIAQLRKDRQTIRKELIDTGNRIKELETTLIGREARLETLFAEQTALRVSLAEQRDTLSEILAALQRIGRNPPPALAIRPGDALGAVRSAILLSTLVPEIRLEAEGLATQLEELIRLKDRIEQERSALATNLNRLGEERKRLALLIERKQEQEASNQKAAKQEKDKIAALATKAKSLAELIEGMEQEIEAAKLAVEDAKLSERAALEQQLETKKQKIDALKDAARLSPAIPFDKMRGLLQLPARGAILKAFGGDDGFGATSKGLTIATRSGAQVSSPADGWIVYSGPFRSFGKLLIINAGDDYHIVLAGLNELYAELGSFVLANEPVGNMQDTRIAISESVTGDLLDTGPSRPMLYMELRKDGVAIDPAPWWTTALNEKADG